MSIYDISNARESVERLLDYTDGAPAQFPMHPHNDVVMLKVFIEEQQVEMERLMLIEEIERLMLIEENIETARLRLEHERNTYKAMAEWLAGHVNYRLDKGGIQYWPECTEEYTKLRLQAAREAVSDE